MKYFLAVFISCLIIFSSCTGSGEGNQEALPQLSVSDAVVMEGEADGEANLTVSLSEASTEAVSVQYKTEDGAAVAGEDYQSVATRILTFEPGLTEQNIVLDIVGDDVREENEQFYVVLSNPINAELYKDTGFVEIGNDDEGNEVLTIPETGYTTPLEHDGMQLVWQDEFEGESLDLASWTYEYGTGSNGWGNNELQFYREENTAIVDGHLVITARHEQHGGRNYTSSRIITKDKKTFKYGRVDIRAVLPEGQGIWPALWMLGNNFSSVGWPACGEIDVMEMIGGSGRENTVHGTIHWSNAGKYANYGGDHKLSSGVFADEFHVFSIVWDANAIKWYVDDQHYHTVDITPAELSEFHAEFFFIFNVAVGGNWPGSPDSGTVFPQRMIVDYIRFFQAD